jgi:TolA-binding protein
MQDLPERQRSMRAVFEYSWKLLPEKDRVIFAKMSQFRGGFTRQAVQKITSANLRNLTSLVNKSLINRNPDTGRYQVHELLRQFAEEQLDDLGELNATCDAHAKYYAKWVDEFNLSLVPDDIKAIRLMQNDFENIKQAWYRLIEIEDFDQLYSFAKNIYSFIRLLLREFDGVTLFQHAREKVGVPIEEVTHPFQRYIYSRFIENEPNRRERLERALLVEKSLGNSIDTAFIKFSLGVVNMIERRFQESVESLLDALDDFQKAEHNVYNVPTLWYLTMVHEFLGDFDEAWSWLERLEAICEESFRPYLVVVYREKLHLILSQSDLTGDYTEAKQVLDDLIRETEYINDQVRAAEASVYQGYLALRERNSALSRQYAEQTLSLCQTGNMLPVKRKALALLGQIELFNNNITMARSYLDQALATPTVRVAFPEAEYGFALLHLIDGKYQDAGKSLAHYIDRNLTNPIRYKDKFGEDVYFCLGFLPIVACIEYGLGNIDGAKMLYQRYQKDHHEHQAWAESLPIMQTLQDDLYTDDPALIQKAEALNLLIKIPEILEAYA